jgi:hypothetical protein
MSAQENRVLQGEKQQTKYCHYEMKRLVESFDSQNLHMFFQVLNDVETEYDDDNCIDSGTSIEDELEIRQKRRDSLNNGVIISPQGSRSAER